jgi:3D (Asp-Asp-Asp) domain-containing protein
LKLIVRPECLRAEYLEPDEDDYNSEDEMQNSCYCLREKDQARMARDQVNAMANHIFGTLASACPHLVALVVEAVREDGIVHDCGGFIRTRQIDMFGETSYVGVPVEKKAIKYYVPRSGILEELAGEDLLNY